MLTLRRPYKSGLFCEALPKKTIHLKDEKCTGGKHDKIRLTAIADANMNGDKLPMFVIGKSNKPRCLALNYLVVANSRRIIGWIHNFSKNG